MAATPEAPFWRDRPFWLAVAAGPLFWLGLSFWIPAGWGGAPPLFLLQVIVLYPLAEELLFRGVLQPALARRLGGRRWGPVSLANLLTTALFCLAHGVLRSAATAALVALPSLLFGHLRERYGGIGAPVALHIFYNAGFYLLFWSG